MIFFRRGRRNGQSFHNQNFANTELTYLGSAGPSAERFFASNPILLEPQLGLSGGKLMFRREGLAIEFGAGLTDEEAKMIADLLTDFQKPYWRRPEEWIENRE